MNDALKAAAAKALASVGLEARARTLWAARNAVGRRNTKDDRALSFFMRAVLDANSCCVDIGAAHGDILREIVRLSPDGQHMAFEPQPAAAQALRANFPSVDVQNIALSDAAGEADFHIATLPQWSGLQQRRWLHTDYQTIRVPLARLDDLAADRRVDFIKIDVEGAQVRVLRGAQCILAKQHPAIWFEHGDRSAGAHGTSRKDVWDVLAENRYRLFTADGVGPLTWNEFASPHISSKIWSYFAH